MISLVSENQSNNVFRVFIIPLFFRSNLLAKGPDAANDSTVRMHPIESTMPTFLTASSSL